MVDFLLFCLATIGTTLILVRGTIFAPFRRFLAHEVERLHRRREKKGLQPGFTLIEFFHELIECVQCMGFWCGLFCGLFFISSDSCWIALGDLGLRQTVNRLLMLFCCGAAGSFLAPFAEMLLDWVFYSKVLLVRKLEEDDRRRAEEAAHQAVPDKELPDA